MVLADLIFTLVLKTIFIALVTVVGAAILATLVVILLIWWAVRGFDGP